LSILWCFTPNMTPKHSHILLPTDLSGPCYKLLVYLSMSFQTRIHYYLQITQLYEEAKETIPPSVNECIL